MAWFRSARARFSCGLFCAYVAVGAALRVALMRGFAAGAPVRQWLGVFALGVGNDALVGGALVAVLAAFLALSGGASLRRAGWRFALGATMIGGMAFAAAVEWYYFAEFGARFNRIALDYLLFPDEVATNVWESYDVPLFVGLAAGVGILGMLPLQRWLRGAEDAAPPLRRRLAIAAFAALGALLATLAAWRSPARPFDDRTRDEIAANGAVQLARAFATAGLDYRSYYRTAPLPEARARAAAELGWANPDDPQRHFPPAVARSRPLDVVVVLEESLGSEFVGRLGGARARTPQFDHWCDAGLLLTNLIATGNRTVRGLEGVLDSFPPLPGDSIWKLDRSQDVASIAGVLRARGYRTEFLYGGAGTFDGMKRFATANGWDRFTEDGVIASDFPRDAFRTAWGVADEYVFTALLDHQRAARAAGAPYFATLMSTSNHKPFLTPDSRDPRRSPDKLRKWGAIGLALAGALGGLGWYAGRRIGRRRFIVGVVVVLAGYGGWLSHKFQPVDTREHAVRYADRALGDYLGAAQRAGLLEQTVVLIVGDHGARVYGAEEIPAASYRIPALFIAPEARWRGATISRLCSQIDLAPTLLSLAGIDHRAPFFGDDLLALPPDGPGRAWLNHNRDIGLLTDDALVVLGLQKTVTRYRRDGRTSDAFVAQPAGDPALDALVERATSVFEVADDLYRRRAFVLPGHR